MSALRPSAASSFVCPTPGRPPSAPRAAASWRRTGSAAALLALSAFWAAPAAAVEFGSPQVLSQSGQRLKIEVPYTLARGEQPSVTRFSIREIRVDGGLSSLSPADMSIAQPANGRYLVLQSREIIDAGRVTLELVVHDDRSAPGRFTLGIPPGQAAPGGDGMTTVVAPDARHAAPAARGSRPDVQRRRPARNTAASA